MSSISPRVRRAVVPVVAALVLVAGCGNKKEAKGTVVKDASPRCAKPSKIAAAKGKPTKIEMPARPAAELVQDDLEVGTGAAAADGKQLTVNYLGVSCTSGQEFDSSWGKGAPDPKTSEAADKPLELVLGKGQVIKGWDRGLRGMKIGGRRRLVIPAALAYGAHPQPGSGIVANDTLVFIVDLLKVSDPPPPTTAPATTAPKATTAPGSSTSTTQPGR